MLLLSSAASPLEAEIAKAALEPCGEEMPGRERCKHSLVPRTQSGGEGSDDDISVE